MSIIISILIFSIVILIHEFGHFVTAKLSGIKVNEFSIGMGPRLCGVKKGDTEYNIRIFPIGGFVAMEGEDEDSGSEGSFNSVPVQSRIAVVVAGAVNNILLGFFILCLMNNMQGAITSKTVSSFYDGAMTEKTGLRVNDEIVAINGRKCYVADDIIYEFARTENEKADFTVIRDGKKVELKDVTFDTYVGEDGVKQLVLDFTVYPIQKTVPNIAKESLNGTVSIARLAFLSLVDMVSGRVELNNMAGPVGVVSTISEVASYGIEPVLYIVALITINLGVFNLIPFPALDGGRLVFLLYELVMKKPINEKYQIALNLAGMVALLGFMAVVTFSDISKIFF
ncbi:MAG: M50 family metallopeptidase [Oscillospiraceae bacterium]|nr:M50 family metallopeptidase [Oscillospiraceae bacterium]